MPSISLWGDILFFLTESYSTSRPPVPHSSRGGNAPGEVSVLVSIELQRHGLATLLAGRSLCLQTAGPLSGPTGFQLSI